MGKTSMLDQIFTKSLITIIVRNTRILSRKRLCGDYINFGTIMRAIMEQSIKAKNRDTVLNDENAEDGNCRMNIQKEVLKCRTR